MILRRAQRWILGTQKFDILRARLNVMEESVLEEPLQKGAGGGQSPVGPGVCGAVGQLMAADNLPVCAMEMMDRLFTNSLIKIRWAWKYQHRWQEIVVNFQSARGFLEKGAALFCPFTLPALQLMVSLKNWKAKLLVFLCLQTAEAGVSSRWLWWMAGCQEWHPSYYLR